MTHSSRRNYQAFLADGLSLGNGACGPIGMIAMIAWDDPRALIAGCMLVFAAWGFDSIDGLAARGLQRGPAPGAVLDSLCDVASFGALPASLLTAFALRGDRALLLPHAIAGVAYFCCAVLRLRRYTVDAVSDTAEQRTSFQGVPSPVAAMSVSAAILAAITGPPALAWLPPLFAVVAAPLMMSEARYIDLPRLAGWMARAKWPLPALALITYAAGNVAVALSLFFAAYFASGVLSRRTDGKSEMRSETS